MVVASRDVSRRHARMFRGPSACWVVEDLGSSNGTYVNGRRIVSCRVRPGDIVEMGPARLVLDQKIGAHADATVVLPGPNIMVVDFGTEVFYPTPRLEDCSEPPCPERLDRLRRRLAGTADLTSMYKEVCCALAEAPKTAAVILRVPTKGGPVPKPTEVLAWHFGSSIEDTMAGPTDPWCPSHRAFRVSRRLLEAVRTDRCPLMTKSIFSCDTEITISLIDEHSPRTLICVPLNAAARVIGLLYVDVHIDSHCRPGPEEMFALAQAVAQRVQEATV